MLTSKSPGDWQSHNTTVPDTDTAVNRTAKDSAWGRFPFEGGGSFTLNLKSLKTIVEDVNYIEVRKAPITPSIDSLSGIHALKRCGQ